MEETKQTLGYCRTEETFPSPTVIITTSHLDLDLGPPCEGSAKPRKSWLKRFWLRQVTKYKLGKDWGYAIDSTTGFAWCIIIISVLSYDLGVALKKDIMEYFFRLLCTMPAAALVIWCELRPAISKEWWREELKEVGAL